MFAPITALVGLTGSGLVSGEWRPTNQSLSGPMLTVLCGPLLLFELGLTLAYPLLINTHFIDQQATKLAPPAPRTANLDIAQRLILWERAFKAGYVIPALAVVSAGALATFALTYDRSDKNSLGKRLGGDWDLRKKLLLGSAALTGSMVAFTILGIMPTNSKLMALRVAANNKEQINLSQAEALLNKWTHLHNVRVAIGFSAFVLALFSFIAV